MKKFIKNKIFHPFFYKVYLNIFIYIKYALSILAGPREIQREIKKKSIRITY